MADAVVTGADSVRHTGGGAGRGVLGSSGVAVTTTAQIAADSALAGTYASKRATFYGDAASQPDGTPATLTSGQAVTVFGNAPTTVTSGKYIHTPFAGAVSPQWLVTGLTPGASYTYVLRHKSSTASTAILKNGDASGYPVTLVVQPAI